MGTAAASSRLLPLCPMNSSSKTGLHSMERLKLHRWQSPDGVSHRRIHRSGCGFPLQGFERLLRVLLQLVQLEEGERAEWDDLRLTQDHRRGVLLVQIALFGQQLLER